MRPVADELFVYDVVDIGPHRLPSLMREEPRRSWSTGEQVVAAVVPAAAADAATLVGKSTQVRQAIDLTTAIAVIGAGRFVSPPIRPSR